MKRILPFIIAVLLTLTLCGCAAGASTRPTDADESNNVTVTGKVEYEIAGGQVTVHATSDIMDGTVVHLSAESVLGDTLAEQDIVKAGDNLTATFDLSSHTGEEIYLFATAAPKLYGKQPKEVFAAYGNKFENLYSDIDGAIIWGNEGVYLVFTTGQIQL